MHTTPMKVLLTTLTGLCLLLTTLTGYAAAERVTYYHNDALGSPVAATDQNGNLLWRESYAPYGARLKEEDGGSNNRWYTGKQEEAAYGINYFGARWYDPSIGRFMAIDPVGFNTDNIQSFNRYAYANNNPYKFVDPDGRNAALAACGAGPVGCVIGVGLTALAINQGIQGTQEALRNENANGDSDGKSDSGQSKGDKENISREKGKRFKSGDDALQQLDEIEKAQRKVRQGKSKQIIDSIEKSRQRGKNFLKDLKNRDPKDFNDPSN